MNHRIPGRAIRQQGKSPYWNKPRMTQARGNPAWLSDKAQQAVA